MEIAPLVSLLQTLSDPTRVRLLALLEREELTVAELTTITELPQSRVSTHLGKLKDCGLLRDRKNGVSSYYALNQAAMPREAGEFWKMVSHELDDALLAADKDRCERLLRERGARWPDSIAGEMERHYSPGRTWEATARGLLGLMSLGDVLDVGAGDGAVAALIGERAKSITLLDKSERLVAAARERLRGHKNVSFSQGKMEELPFSDSSFDTALMLNVLTYSEEPARALCEVRRVLRSSGRLSLVTLHAHEHAALTKAYGHLHPGFTLRQLTTMLQKAGFETESVKVTSRERKKPHFEVVTALAVRRSNTAPNRRATGNGSR